MDMGLKEKTHSLNGVNSMSMNIFKEKNSI